VGAVVAPTTTTPEAEEEMAVDPRFGVTSNHNLVATISDFALRSGFNTTKYAVSTDNGSTWSENYVPLSGGFPATNDGGTTTTWQANSDPTVAIDKAGNVFLANLYLNGSNNANGFYVSVGNLANGPSLGITISSTIPVATNLSPTTTNLEDKDWIAVDNSAGAPATGGNVYVAWTHFTATTHYVLFSRSTDHGATWSTPIQISLPAQNGAVEGSQVAVGPSGEVYVGYEVFFAGGKRQQYLAKSTDGGVSFSSAAAITPVFGELSFSSTYRKNSFPALAVSPTNGDVYVAYAAQFKGPAGAQIEFVRSTDGGATFGSPITVNDVSTGQQFFPAVAVDAQGFIHVSWFDTRNSRKTASHYDIFATYSNDNGLTFATNARVTASQINAGTAAFIGDYSGIAAAGGFAHPVWTSGGFNGGLLQTATLTLPSGVSPPPLFASNTASGLIINQNFVLANLYTTPERESLSLFGRDGNGQGEEIAQLLSDPALIGTGSPSTVSLQSAADHLVANRQFFSSPDWRDASTAWFAATEWTAFTEDPLGV
jgi:hypothetical protein